MEKTEFEEDKWLAIEQLQEENSRLKAWVEDFQSGMYVNCVYCGWRAGENKPEGVPADILKEHIQKCPEHPVSKLKKEVDLLENQIALLKDAIIWCSGSDDFSPGGKAYEGWVGIVRPLIKDEKNQDIGTSKLLGMEPIKDLAPRWIEVEEGDNPDDFPGLDGPILAVVETNSGPQYFLGTIDGEGTLVDLQYGEDVGWQFDCIDKWCPLEDVLRAILHKGDSQ